MNELDLTNTQAVIFIVVLIGLLLYLNHLDRKKSAQFERENQQTIETGRSKNILQSDTRRRKAPNCPFKC